MSDVIAWEIIPTPRIEKTPGKSKKPSASMDQPSALNKGDLLFIKDLKPAEKSKIAFMIQQVLFSYINCLTASLLFIIIIIIYCVSDCKIRRDSQ